jgi:hypothetical protein
MPDFFNAASWDEEDDDEPAPRAVYHDAEPDTRERGARTPGRGRPPAPRGGYRIRSDETWEKAREAYSRGETAEEVAFRFDLGLSTLHARAREEGWRRSDQQDPEDYSGGYRSARGASRLEPVNPRLDDGTCHIGADEGYAALADRALTQLRRAMAQGRGGAAASWMRVHDRLISRAEAEARRALAEANEVAARVAREEAVARRSAERAAAELRDALAGAPAGETALDADARAEEDVIAAIEALVARVARTDPRDMAERAACEAELARIKRLNARFDGALPAGLISDDSEDSESNSSAPPGDP